MHKFGDQDECVRETDLGLPGVEAKDQPRPHRSVFGGGVYGERGYCVQDDGRRGSVPRPRKIAWIQLVACHLFLVEFVPAKQCRRLTSMG